jgi:hypothetical protein
MIDTAPSRQVLAELPARLVTFLGACGKYPAIRAQMAAAGYTQADHDHGWVLLQGITGYQKAALPNVADVEVRDAALELDAWDELNFRVIQACLAHKHPAQGAFLFEGLEPSKGLKAIVGIKLLLDRVNALESSPDRAATREEDHAALATLARRGYTPAEWQRLGGLVTIARRGTQQVDLPSTASAAPSPVELEAHRFFNDWAETARARVKRRDQLILLGLAKRRRAKEDDTATDDDGETPPETPPL